MTEDLLAKYLVPIIIAIIAGVPGTWALIRQVKKEQAETAKIRADAALTEANKDRVYYDLSRDAGEDVITRNTRIDTLETMLKVTNTRIEWLETALGVKDRRIDELEAKNKVLQSEVDELREKVKLLEAKQ